MNNSLQKSLPQMITANQDQSGPFEGDKNSHLARTLILSFFPGSELLLSMLKTEASGQYHLRS